MEHINFDIVYTTYDAFNSESDLVHTQRDNVRMTLLACLVLEVMSLACLLGTLASFVVYLGLKREAARKALNVFSVLLAVFQASVVFVFLTFTANLKKDNYRGCHGRFFCDSFIGENTYLKWGAKSGYWCAIASFFVSLVNVLFNYLLHATARQIQRTSKQQHLQQQTKQPAIEVTLPDRSATIVLPSNFEINPNLLYRFNESTDKTSIRQYVLQAATTTSMNVNSAIVV
ncbi:hypothetical protein SAMD00019534_008180 [Acytostelium subglobosum LB1]|uniref:hypothetical protein n=1 Tax=Acytostelium subglobosum LB1 TaxID=1410327 RepID=UPI000644F33E|nr:hypothetical protein SAMD00019534_008180 [Acytostelium subglobosum LB1]GAM17643.1 hypothetical protein SAMD00019534_008180 [Acytostelium subglobosum LB1]|eukprot:XP_012758239.1 hypothetical protein SAMD00019534_008180 [Acytostelium subglobosum LB1]